MLLKRLQTLIFKMLINIFHLYIFFVHTQILFGPPEQFLLRFLHISSFCNHRDMGVFIYLFFWLENLFLVKYLVYSGVRGSTSIFLQGALWAHHLMLLVVWIIGPNRVWQSLHQTIKKEKLFFILKFEMFEWECEVI